IGPHEPHIAMTMARAVAEGAGRRATNIRPTLLPPAAAGLLGGCGAAPPEAGPAPAASASASAEAAPAQPLTITDPWVKAAEDGMTAAFGTLVNHTDSPITVVGATSPLSSKIELLEVVESGDKPAI